MQKIIHQLNKSLEIKEELILVVKNEEELTALLSNYIQELINTNFEHLLWLLYRIDVGETKVIKAINSSNTSNTSVVIAKMIIEREKQKIETRKKHSSSQKEIDDDWIF